MTERQNKKNKNQSPKPKAHNPKPKATGYGLRATGARGFSFIEVLVSIFLITVGMMAAMTLFSKNLAALIRDRNQVVASLLAQEGAELVRNIRDTNWANDQNAFEINFPIASSNDCIIDLSQTELSCNKSLDEENLYYTPIVLDSTSSAYLHTNNDESAAKFKRKLSITYDNIGTAAGASSATMVSLVVWGEDFSGISNVTDCTFQKKCAYVESVLTTWDDI